MKEKANKIKINVTYEEIMQEVWGGAEEEYVTDEQKVERVKAVELGFVRLFERRPKPQKGKTNKKR